MRRGLSFLSEEVPRWRQENNCYSCHNNGDAARALYMAKRLGYRIDSDTLADTTAWLGRPDRWKHNGGEGDFNEKDLATLQFSAALAEAVRAEEIDGEKALRCAARMVARFQQENGSWQVNASGSTGSPASYGDALATVAALRVFRQVDLPWLKSHIDKGEQWLRNKTPKNVLTAASLLIGLRDARDEAAARQRTKCLALIAAGQTQSGGWGPFADSAPEPFDTAIVLLALAGLRDDAGRTRMIQQGRRYLAETQLGDGS